LNCLICESASYRIIHSYDRPDAYERAAGLTGEGYWRQWVRCGECGFHYSRYSRAEDILNRFYKSAYRTKDAPWRSETTEETFNRVIALPEGQSETRARIRWIKEQIKDLHQSDLIHWEGPPYGMLDIGGATGVFAYHFQDEEWRSHVIDPADDGRFVETSLGIPYVQRPYETGSFDKPFELIAMVFVLEHLHQPMEILERTRKDMATDGLLYVEVPDAVVFRYKPAEDDIFNACHLWMFDPISLVRLLDRSGFDTLCLRRTRTVRGYYSLMVLGKEK
jgi:hypothetical protein